jgi:hypothetical protein
MNLQQVGQLMTLASLMDNRQVTAESAQAWHVILADVDYDAAVTAMYAHFRERPDDYLVVGHIVKRVEAQQLALTERTMSPAAPEACLPDDHRWLADGTCMHCTQRRGRRGGGGAPRPENMDALMAAWNDPQQWAVEVARYNDQLTAAGLDPVLPLRGRASADRVSNESSQNG